MSQLVALALAVALAALVLWTAALRPARTAERIERMTGMRTGYYPGQQTQYVLESGNVLTKHADQRLVLPGGAPDMSFMKVPAAQFDGTRVNGYASIGGKWVQATPAQARAVRARRGIRV